MKTLPAHLAQQICLLIRSYEIRNVIRVVGSWDVLLSDVHVVVGLKSGVAKRQAAQAPPC